MTHLFQNRSRLMGGCASAALALALVLAPERAAAQGIQGSGNVVLGSAEINITGPNTTTVDLFTSTVVIDWTPAEDINGNALNFIDTGATGIFQTSLSSNFAVLNRVLPSTNNNIVTIDGQVVSRFLSPLGPQAAGLVAFYSPTGILVGSNATFDVGQLLLTTLDTADLDFANFAIGGNMTMAGAPGTTARIQINPGAQILATPENAFFAVVAADIEMRGSAFVNGSHAFVAGEVVNLSFSNGLFNIFVPVGTSVSGQVVTVDGTVGGPSSNGFGDNHMIYGVAHAAADPISMLFSGNLGFDPAMSAGIVNGEIILAANYNVFGRFVNGGSVSDGINAVFNQNSATSDIRADIFLESFTATSSLLAIGTHTVVASALNSASSVSGNLMVVGREEVEVTSNNGQSFTITGDVLVDSRDYGVFSSSLQSLDEINAQGGISRLTAGGGSVMSIGGDVLVTASAFGGAEDINGIAGFAQGGGAFVIAASSMLDIAGSATITANASGNQFIQMLQGAEARAGEARLFSILGGNVSIGQNLNIGAQATAANGSIFNPSSVSNAYGGLAQINLVFDNSTLSVGGQTAVVASARGGSSNNAGAGSIGDAGQALINLTGPASIDFQGTVLLVATGTGGNNAGGTGGVGLGGRASANVTDNGFISFDGNFNANTLGVGGNGQIGGDGSGGIAGVIAEQGGIFIFGNAFAGTEGVGGNASFGFGGDGGLGRGGNSFFQANGNANGTALLTIGGDAVAFAQGVGGDGGSSDGSSIAAGRGGDGRGGSSVLPNQADPNFNSGAYFLASADYGSITVGGDTVAVAQGYGGTGGEGTFDFDGGRGGDGFGGLAQVGLALLGGTGAIAGGAANFNFVLAQADGFGGGGGISGFDFPTGDGGNGTGGLAVLTVRAGTVTAGDIDLTASGYGANGGIGGLGQGGRAAIVGGLGGSLTASNAFIQAEGFGGSTGIDTGGSGIGGSAAIEGDGIIVNFSGNVAVNASARGGFGDNAFAGNAQGGTAYIAFLTPSNSGAVIVGGHAQVFANGLGGNTVGEFSAADGTGGIAYVETRGGGNITLGSAHVTAVGRGGGTFDHRGGNGTGGTVRLLADGPGSALTISRNIPIGFNNTLGSAFLLNANGIGEATRGGNGVGGTGTGGILTISASGGAAIVLPIDVANDPNAVAPLVFLTARGFGGGSAVNGGVGGVGNGGTALMQLSGIGTSIEMGASVLSSFGQGGSSISLDADVTGGVGNGGSREISVSAGATLTAELAGGVASGIGGRGSGLGNGGNGFGGINIVELFDATLNIVGVMAVVDQTEGGTGVIGGNANGDSGSVSFTATNSVINMFGNAAGEAAIRLGGFVRGGDGVVRGGDARTAATQVNISNTQINGGKLDFRMNAVAGSASLGSGAGGDAFSGALNVDISGSTLQLGGGNAFITEAFGGAGGSTNGTGGFASSGSVNVTMTNSALTIQLSGSPEASQLVMGSRAVGGLGLQSTGAISAVAALNLFDSSLIVNEITVYSDASAISGIGGIGGTARGGEAQFSVVGASNVNADLIAISASGETSPGGASFGGLASLLVDGSAAQVNAATLGLRADGFGADPANPANVAGRFRAVVLGGDVNLATLEASALGDAIVGTPLPSELAASSGSINVVDFISATALGDISVFTSGGGFIGTPSVNGTTGITISTSGNINIEDDDSGLEGLSGERISLSAGGSILLGGTMGVNNGPINISANNGTALPSGVDQTATISMTAGTTIGAGSGTVAITMGEGSGVPGRLSGGITLANIIADQIYVRNFGTDPGSDITVLSTGVLTASGSGRAIDLASLSGEVINLNGDAGLILTGGGHFGIFAESPTGSQIGSFGNYARRYNVADAQAYDAIDLGGNFAAFRIVPVLTVTADDLSRFYGDANPLLTASIAGFQPGDSIFDLLGAPDLATLADSFSDVGLYTITAALGTLASEQGYEFTFAPGTLSVTPRPITITADNLSRFYGNANPALTFTVGGLGLVNGDEITGALATTATLTTNVGNVAITQGTVGVSTNYDLTFVEGVLTITPRPITVTADNLSRIYGEANPALTFTVGGLGLVNGDQLTGALATTANATTNVGTAAITQGTLAASSNYDLTYIEGTLTITPRPITVTADNLSRIYGDQNPLLTFTVGGLGLVNGDQLTGALATTANATTNVGTAAITQGTLAASSNYDLTYIEGTLTITPRPITVTADNLSRIYGDQNPLLTFTVGGLGLVNGDQLTGALATTANATTNVGTAAITQGTLAASSNYDLTYIEGTLTITPRPITVTADNLSRIYGDQNPLLTFTVGGLGLVNGDQLTGALATTANATTNVGTAAITQGTLAASSNYDLTYIEGTLTITPRPITVTADNLSRIYGDQNPLLTFTVGGLGLVNGDQLTGALATTANATTNVGTAAITQGTLAASSNYDLTYIEGTLTITPRSITVTADNLSRIYGDQNPLLTFTVGGLGLVNGDQLTGALATTANATTNVGTAAITQGTLAASSNYDLTYIEGTLTITPRSITVTADNLSRIYGDQNPLLTFTVGGLGLVNGDQLTGALATTANATTNVGTAAITQGSLSLSSNYSLSFVDGTLTITPRPITVIANNLSRIYGNANPALTFTVGGFGLVNGDQITGALATTANATTGVGSIAITQGTLGTSSNYALTFVNGTLAITPRPLTITADDLAKLLGQSDPELTYTVGGDGLVNGDTIDGGLARDSGETVGTFVIRQGTLSAGQNYTITYVPGDFTIKPPPTPSEVTSPTALEPSTTTTEEALPPASEEEEEEQFGMDFPAQPDAQLIAEDALLDDPVTSGGDASLYGGSDIPPAGGQ